MALTSNSQIINVDGATHPVADILALVSGGLSANWLTVDGGGGGDYTTLTDANSAATAGDLIVITRDTTEPNSVILKEGVNLFIPPGVKLTFATNKDLKVSFANQRVSGGGIISGDSPNNTLQIVYTGSLDTPPIVEGVTITSTAGIARTVTIQGGTLQNCYIYGRVFVLGATYISNVLNNRVRGGEAIYVSGAALFTIHGNYVDNANYGVRIQGGTPTAGSRISHNYLKGNVNAILINGASWNPAYVSQNLLEAPTPIGGTLVPAVGLSNDTI